MELYPFHRVGGVPQSHNESVRRLRGNLQFIRESGALDNEAVIAVGFKGQWEIAKNPLPLVIHQRCFPMHRLWRAHDLPTVHLPDGLMSQADTQRGNVRPKSFDDLAGYSGLARRAWAG